MKQKNVWLVISIIFAIVVIIGGVYVTTDLFKSPEQLFYKHLAQNSKLLGNASYEETMKELQKQNEASREVSGEVTAELQSKESGFKEIAEILNKGKITYNIKQEGTEKSKSDITFNYDKKDIVTLSLLQNKEQYGVKIAEAYDKYISVENNNLKALFQKLGIDATNIPNKFETLNYYEFLKIDKKTLNHIEETYSKVMKENIPSECYTIEKDVKTIFNGSELKTNAYKLKLSEEQSKTILMKVFETLKTDDITLDLIIEKYNKMMEPYQAMGISMENAKIEKEDLKEAIAELVEELKETYTSEKAALEIIVYAAKDGIAKIELTVEDEVDTIKFELGMVNTRENRGTVIKCTLGNAKIDIIVNYKDNHESLIFAIESEGTRATIKISADIKATGNVKVESFTKDNSVKLNDMTREEMEELVQRISENAEKVLPQKMELLGISTSTPVIPNDVTGSTLPIA